MRRGFTLFEVVISLLMLIVLLGAIGTAVHSYLGTLDVSRTETAEAQLARAVLEKIGRDLRNIVVPLREEELEVDTDLIQESLLGASIDSDLQALAGQLGSDSTSATGETSEAEAEEETIYGEMPGIYGDLEWIQIDTARLPRGEMFGSKITTAGVSPLSDRLSPSKTVLYYLGEDTGQRDNAGTWESRAAELDSLGRPRDQRSLKSGLYRRELDRMATQYMLDQGTETEREEYDDLLAPEVEAIQFEYFDPAETEGSSDSGDWVETWDMDDIGYLPKAVRITVWIRKAGVSRSASDNPLTRINGVETVVFSLVVILPVASPEKENAESTDESASL